MPKRLFALVAVTGALVAATYALRDEPDVERRPVPSTLQSSGTVDRGELERLIRAYEERVASNPTALQYTFLGRLYLEQGTLVGDLGSYARAEEVLRASLELFPGDPEAATLLATARYTMHDFAGALAIASGVDEIGARAVVGDASLELGRYGDAAAVYDELTQALPGVAAVDARRARLAFLRGDIRSAASFAERAASAARDEGAFGPGLARYHVAVSTLAFERGEYDVAADAAARALAAADGWHVALATLARAQAARGETGDAIDLYRRAVDIVPEPGTVAALGDLLALTGDDAGAREQYDTVAVLAQLAGGVFDRQLVRFLADHDRVGDDLVELAAADLALRPDVYGHDALAWALYATGSFERARAESDLALALGTRDARLLFHAGMISAALGEGERAREELQAALDLSPEFDPLQAPLARATLEELS